MIVPYTIWSADRAHKTIILIDDEEFGTMYESLILKASLKMGLNGTSIVLESNGTPVEPEVVPYLKKEVFMLLQNGEVWEEPKKASELDDTISVQTGNTSSSITLLSTVSSGPNEAILFNNNEAIPIQVFTPVENAIIEENVDCNSEKWWMEFKIPWDKLSANQLENLKNSKKDTAMITRLTQVVVDEMRIFKKIIPMKAFKIVARKIIETYPLIFLDVDRDGILLGDGSHKLVSKLIDRNNYLNRPNYKRRSESSTNPKINKKKFVSARAGCSNWDPEIIEMMPDTERKKCNRESDEDFYNVLETTYPELRQYLNAEKVPSISNIKEEWPITLSKKAIKWHFNKLTNSNIDFIERIVEDFETIKSIHKKKNNVEDAGDNLDLDPAARCLVYISKHFSEKIEDFIIFRKDLAEIKKEQLPLTPCIIINGYDSQPVTYSVVVERETIDADAYDSFIEAFKSAFAVYFMLNLKYPTRLQATFELIQRMYLKIHPDSGSKSNTRVTGTKKKVFNYMLKFTK